MRVALITDGIYPYVIGGMQKHSFYIAKYLAKNRVYVDLFHFNAPFVSAWLASLFKATRYCSSLFS